MTKAIYFANDIEKINKDLELDEKTEIVSLGYGLAESKPVKQPIIIFESKNNLFTSFLS